MAELVPKMSWLQMILENKITSKKLHTCSVHVSCLGHSVIFEGQIACHFCHQDLSDIFRYFDEICHSPDIHSFDSGHVRISVRTIETDNFQTGGRITNSFILNQADDWSKLKIFKSDQSNDFKSFTKMTHLQKMTHRASISIQREFLN